LEDKEAFWTKQAEELTWFKKFETVIDESDEYLKRWFPDGECNICYNAVDRHVEDGRGNTIALQSDSVYTGKKETFTYKEV
jgi:propionyl-CoA synthetase